MDARRAPGTLAHLWASCVVGSLALLSAGCAGTTAAQQAALMQEVQRTVPVCREDGECEAKWAAARDWVLRHAGRRLLQATGDYIETANPPNATAESIEVRVIKEGQPDGSYRILATVWCESYSACVPDRWIALKSFNDTVNASWQPALPR